MSSLRTLMVATLMLGSFCATAAAATNRPVPEPAVQTAVADSELQCLAMAIYFEARGEPLAGKFAVGHVILNRTAHPRFPQQICGVVKQGGDRHRHRCQFSFWCDGQSDKPTDKRAWRESVFVATLVASGMVGDVTGGALWYHAEYVNPDWAQDFAPEARVQIGRHIFYGTSTAEFRIAGQVCRPSSEWTWSV